MAGVEILKKCFSVDSIIKPKGAIIEVLPIFGHVMKFITKKEHHGKKKERKKGYITQFKEKVAFEAANENRNITEIAFEYGIHPQQVRAWRREFLEKIHHVFGKEKDIVAVKNSLKKPIKG